MPLRKNNNAAKFIVSLKQNIRKASSAHHKSFFPEKQTSKALKETKFKSVRTLNIRGLIIFSRILRSLVRQLNFTRNDLCATSDKNTNFNGCLYTRPLSKT